MNRVQYKTDDFSPLHIVIQDTFDLTDTML